MYRLSGRHVDLFGELRLSRGPQLNVVSAGAHPHGLEFPGGSRKGAVNEYLGVLHLRVQFHLAGVRHAVVGSVRAVKRTVSVTVTVISHGRERGTHKNTDPGGRRQ